MESETPRTQLTLKCNKHKAASVMKMEGETRQAPQVQVQSTGSWSASKPRSIASIHKLCDWGTLEIMENMHRIVWRVARFFLDTCGKNKCFFLLVTEKHKPGGGSVSEQCLAPPTLNTHHQDYQGSVSVIELVCKTRGFQPSERLPSSVLALSSSCLRPLPMAKPIQHNKAADNFPEI